MLNANSSRDIWKEKARAYGNRASLPHPAMVSACSDASEGAGSSPSLYSRQRGRR